MDLGKECKEWLNHTMGFNFLTSLARTLKEENICYIFVNMRTEEKRLLWDRLKGVSNLESPLIMSLRIKDK